MSEHRLREALKEVIEKMAPDLRKSLIPPVTGTVTAVDEDGLRCNADIADIPAEGQEPADPWKIDAAPVSSLTAGDGFGVWALPEVGAEVTVSFKDFDLTQPRISGAEFLSNRTPTGGRVGSFVIADNAGQRLVLRPDTGDIVFRAINVDDEAAGTRSERTIGMKLTDVLGNLNETVRGHAKRTFEGNLTEAVTGNVTRSNAGFTETSDLEEGGRYFQRGVTVDGAERKNVKGGQSVQVGGDRDDMVLGDVVQTVGKNVSQVVGGVLDILVGGVVDDPRHLAACQIGAPGPTAINCFGGYFQEPLTGAIVGAPMINGTRYQLALAAYLTAVSAALGTLTASFPVEPGTAPVTTGEMFTKLGIFSAAMTAAAATFAAATTASLSLRHYLGGPI